MQPTSTSTSAVVQPRSLCFCNGTSVSLLSLKLGAVRLTERYLKSDPPKAKEIAALKAEVHAAFERPRRELRNARWQQASGTSGTILSIGTTLRDAGSNNSDRKNQAVQPTETDIPLSKLPELNAQLAQHGHGPAACTARNHFTKV